MDYIVVKPPIEKLWCKSKMAWLLGGIIQLGKVVNDWWGLTFYEMHVCEAIIDVAKHILLKQDNLEKHMEKQWAKHNIPNKGLKEKPNLLQDLNDKHSHNLVFFATWWPPSILQQMGDGMDVEV